MEEKNQNPLLKLLSSFWGPIPWMIEIAAVLSAVVGHWTDFYIVLALLILNAVVGFWEEHQAGNAINALKSHLAMQARVKGSGIGFCLASYQAGYRNEPIQLFGIKSPGRRPGLEGYKRGLLKSA